MNHAVRTRALRRASQILGGEVQLSRYLRVSALSVTVWMAGAETPPTDVFLKAVDVIVERDLENLRGPHEK